jgi:hypothetical protein
MRHTRRAVSLIGVLGAICSLGAGGAVARPRIPSITFYKVVYQGSGSYSVNQTDGPSFGKITSGFHWKVAYLLSVFHKSGQPVTGLARKHQGGGDWSIVSDNGGGDQCSRHGGLQMTPNGVITGRVQPSGAVNMKLLPGGGTDFITTDGSSGPKACDTTDYWHDWVVSFSKVGSSDTEDFDPLTAFIHLSRGEQRAGKVIANVSSHTLAAPSLTVNPDCGSGNGATCTQSFDWKGTVTLTKTTSPRF